MQMMLFFQYRCNFRWDNLMLNESFFLTFWQIIPDDLVEDWICNKPISVYPRLYRMFRIITPSGYEDFQYLFSIIFNRVVD